MMMVPLRRFHKQFNNIIKILIVSDFLVWSSANMITVVFSVFVIDDIENGSLEVAGLSTMIYLVVSAITTIPMGIIMDKNKGFVDEVKFLFWGTLIRGVCLYLFAVVSQVWHIYVLHVVLGITRASMLPSWRLLFSNYTDADNQGVEWSTYDAVTTMGMGITAYLGTFIAEEVSYSLLFEIAGIATLLGAFLIVFLRIFIKAKKKSSS